MKKAGKALEELRHRSAELTNLNNIMALMHWDQEVTMPPGATKERAGQFSTLSTIIHKKLSCPGRGMLRQQAEEDSAACENDWYNQHQSPPPIALLDRIHLRLCPCDSCHCTSEMRLGKLTPSAS